MTGDLFERGAYFKIQGYTALVDKAWENHGFTMVKAWSKKPWKAW